MYVRDRKYLPCVCCSTKFINSVKLFILAYFYSFGSFERKKKMSAIIFMCVKIGVHGYIKSSQMKK